MNVQDIVSNPNVMAAGIGALGALATHWLGNRLGIQLKRQDIAATNLAAQLEGWERFAKIWQTEVTSMREQIVILEKHIHECEAENLKLNERIFRLENRFDGNL